MQENVTCIVVTYNRKVLLEECLNAIYSQTVSIRNMILIDNASTDGTKEMLKSKGFLDKKGFGYHLMESNLGGSGGFYEGMKRVPIDTDWIWIMDDDTIPNPDCLEKLLVASKVTKEKVSFYASSVFGPVKEPMNIPTVDFELTENGYPDWYFYLKNKMVKICDATFVSLLINNDALKKCGLPCKDYFIWGDDTEYTTRLTTHYGPAYMVGDSVVCHKRVGAKALSITSEDNSNRIKNYFYYYRNLLVNTYIYKGKKEGSKLTVKCFVFGVKLLRKDYGFEKCKTVLRAVKHGCREWKNFAEYISEQIGEEKK